MEWLVFAALAAVFYVLISIISKKLMDGIDPTVFTAILITLGLIFYTPVFLYRFELTQLIEASTIIEFISISLILNILGWFSYNYAIKNDPVSTVMPLNRLQPVFVAIFGFFLLNEAVTFKVAFGVFMASLGGYIVLIKDAKHLLSPFQEIFSDRGEQMAILSGLTFAGAAIVDRTITTTIDPLIHAFFLLIGMTVAFNMFNYKKHSNYTKIVKKQLISHIKLYTVAGLLQASALGFILTAFSLQEASRVVPVLQLQVPLTVIAGGALFEEENILVKLIGSIILLIGVFLVV